MNLLLHLWTSEFVRQLKSGNGGFSSCPDKSPTSPDMLKTCVNENNNHKYFNIMSAMGSHSVPVVHSHQITSGPYFLIPIRWVTQHQNATFWQCQDSTVGSLYDSWNGAYSHQAIQADHVSELSTKFTGNYSKQIYIFQRRQEVAYLGPLFLTWINFNPSIDK